MSLVDWRSLPVRVKRSRKRLYGVLADEYNLVTWMELPNEVKRSKKKLYDFIANELNIDSFEELPVECRRSTRLMYTFIQENGGGGSTDTLTVVVTDGADPITGATVTVDGDSEITGSDGKATFTVEYGDYEATISASGYTTKTEELKFRSNKKSFTITLEASGGGSTGTVTLTCKTIQSLGGDLLEGATVILKVDDGQPPSPETILGMGVSDSEGISVICELDGQGEPTTTPLEIEYGTYALVGEYDDGEVQYYGGDLITVDNATVTKELNFDVDG